jgi:hypothetical protein
MRKLFYILVGALIIISLASSLGQGPGVNSTSIKAGSIPAARSLNVDRDFGKIALYFIPNEGQVDARVAYYLRGKDKTVYFTSEGLTYVLNGKGFGNEKDAGMESGWKGFPTDTARNKPESPSRWAVKLDFVGANTEVRPSGEEKTGAVISYFKGKPAEWKTGLPAFSRLVYKNLWPGIDLAYYGTVDKMKYEFIVYPGSDPSSIRLAYRGVNSMEVDGEGRLTVKTPAGSFADDRPTGYQEINEQRTDVALRYLLERETVKDPGPNDIETETRSFIYGFEVGDFDRTKPLVLDPAILLYCGFIGGSGDDKGYDISVDSEGSAYITGRTDSTEATFPVNSGLDLTYNSEDDAFIAKVNASGTGLVYCSYLGGSGGDYGRGITVDSSGNAYICGYTASSAATFPVLYGPDLTHNGSLDAFVAKINSTGTAMYYCGYIGGSEADTAYAIAIDMNGDIYVTGSTWSTQATFPVLGGPDLTHNGNVDAFVAKVSSATKALVFCGYIGGSEFDTGYGISVRDTFNGLTFGRWTYMTGATASTEATFPVLGGLHNDLTHNGNHDAFVASVLGDGTLASCEYIGGSGVDYGYDIAVVNEGTLLHPFAAWYITGQTSSSQATFPVVNGPDLTHNGGYDVFVAKYRSGFIYSGYIGGSGNDYGDGITVGPKNTAYITGSTYSSEATFPVVDGPDLTYNGNGDVFVARVNPGGTALLSCGYIGGSSNDYGGSVGGGAIAVDGSGNAYITSCTSSTSTTFPVIRGPDLSYNLGAYDAFVAKISFISPRKVDFNADGMEDILWRHYGTGQNAVWYLGGFTASGTVTPLMDSTLQGFAGAMEMKQNQAPKVCWDISEVGGFRGQPVGNMNFNPQKAWAFNAKQGGGDIFPPHAQMAASGVPRSVSPAVGPRKQVQNTLGYAFLRTVTDLNWKIDGTGDIDGNGKIDILWRNYSTGQNAVWFMNGITETGYSYLAPVTDLTWKIQGSGDFNGDGMIDILWRNYSTGQNAVWYTNGITNTGYAYLREVTDLNWQIVGTGDIDGNGKIDILWRNYSTGQNAIWFMDGITDTGYLYLQTVTDLAWKIEGTGDFNGDGKIDILWRNYSAAQTAVWYMNGGTSTTYSYDFLQPLTDPSWKIGNR